MIVTKAHDSNLLIYIIPIGALIAVITQQLWGTSNIVYGMYANHDGEWAAWNLSANVQWSLPFDLSPFNPLSGLGSSFLPNLPWLNPAAWPFFLDVPRDLQYLLGYFIYMTEIAISLVILLSSLKLPKSTLTCVILAYLLFLFPPFSILLQAMEWYSLAPVNAHLVAMANVIFALLIRCGASKLVRENLILALGITVAAIMGFYSAPVTFLTYAPVYGFFFLAMLMSLRPQISELVWKFGILILLNGGLIAIGFLEYLTATSQMSARAGDFLIAVQSTEQIFTLEYWNGLWNRFSICDRPQFLLCQSLPIFYVHIAALFGAIREIHRPSSEHTRMLGLFYVLFVAGVHTYEFISQDFLLGKIHVIHASYYVWAAYPFAILFAVLFILQVIRKGLAISRAETALGRIAPRFPAFREIGVSLLAGICAVSLSVVAWTSTLSRHHPPPASHKIAVSVLGPAKTRTPYAGPIVQYLVEQTALSPGGLFRGYTASFFGSERGHIQKAYLASDENYAREAEGVYIFARGYLDRMHQHRMQLVDMWLFGIPTYEEYAQWIGPDFHHLNERLFGNEETTDGDFLHIHKLDVDLLRMFGVRFIITDIELNDPQASLRVTENGQNDTRMRLYELSNPNLASFSPTEFIQADTVEQTVSALKSQRAILDTWGVVRTTTLADSDYVPAISSELFFERDGFSVRANTSGRSIVVLPIRYSRCFEQQPGGTGTAQLWRINGVLSAIEFTGTIDVRYRYAFGLFSSAQCRLHDNDDIIAMGF